MLKQYQNPKNIIPVMSSPFKVFFLELGVYDSEVEMKESTIKFPFYIYTLKDNKYYVYIGITKNENNEDVKTKFGVFEVNIIHYIGEFYTGDSLFIVAILGPHRQKSYEALIDTIERVKFDIDFEKEEISNQGSKTILAVG